MGFVQLYPGSYSSSGIADNRRVAGKLYLVSNRFPFNCKRRGYQVQTASHLSEHAAGMTHVC